MDFGNSRPSNRKVLVLCFDGATFKFIKPWAEEGKLPTFKKIIDSGVMRVLESTIPPISATAWVTFLTGKNPGKHGIFEFRVIDPNTYMGLTNTVVNSGSISGKTIIDYAGVKGLKVCSIAMPITYPAWEINGMMISGTPTPDNSKAYTYPLGLDFGVMTPYPHQKMRLTVEQKRLHGEFEANKRTDILCDALRSNIYNLFLLHLHTADAAHHNYWRFFDQECPAYSSKEGYGKFMFESYQILDRQLKKVLDLVEEGTPVLIISDHGGCRRPRRQLHLNSWLRKKGYIKFYRLDSKRFINSAIIKTFQKLKPFLPMHYFYRLSEKKTSFRNAYFAMKKNIGGIDWPRSKAYMVEMHHPAVGVEINLKGRQSEGCVGTKEEYEDLIEELSLELLKIVDPLTNEKVIKKVARRDDLYWGENLEKSPDIVLFLNEDHDVTDEHDESIITDTPSDRFMEKSGYHDLDGIFIAAGKEMRKNCSLDKARLIDMPATILHLLGLPIPKDMDSKVLTDIFSDSFIKSNPVTYTDPLDGGQAGLISLSATEEEQMKEQLKGLGYLE